MSARVFIDGQAGTTGLRIRDWLAGRDDLELVEVAEARRKDAKARRDCFASADLAVLCLPDDAAAEAVAWLGDAQTRILDASTAHRVAADWVYGLPELGDRQREAIASAERVSNPGCYPSATIVALRPLVDERLGQTELSHPAKQEPRPRDIDLFLLKLFPEQFPKVHLSDFLRDFFGNLFLNEGAVGIPEAEFIESSQEPVQFFTIM